MSDTPRTDAAEARRPLLRADLLKCARSLERELTAEKQRSERLEKALNSARDHLLSPGARPETVAKEMVAARKIIDAALGDSNG